MARKRYTPEQIIGKLRAIEVHISSGMTSEQAARQEEISVQSYFRWRKEYGGLKLDQAKRFKELEKENARLKRLVAELSLDKQMLQEVASGRLQQGAALNF
jgi:putative transposase